MPEGCATAAIPRLALLVYLVARGDSAEIERRERLEEASP